MCIYLQQFLKDFFFAIIQISDLVCMWEATEASNMPVLFGEITGLSNICSAKYRRVYYKEKI